MQKLLLLICVLAFPAEAIFKCHSAFRTWSLGELNPVALLFTNSELPIAVIGAGPGGLAALKALHKAGINAEGIERHSGVGGLWDTNNAGSPAYSSLQTNASISSQHLGDPWPAGTPHFVSHRQALEYLQGFATRHGLDKNIHFETEVLSVDKTDRGSWLVQTRGPQGIVTKEYRAVVIASGRHNRALANIPEDLWDQANAAGLSTLHSADYRDPDSYRGKRVLIVGLGNSAADIATEISAVAQTTIVSVRSAPWIVPLTVLGKPADQIGQKTPSWVPHSFEVAVFQLLQRITVGHPSSFGLPSPDHKLLDRLPISDRGFVQAIKNNKIDIRSNVVSLTGGTATYENPDQSPESFDSVVFATGYRRAYKFLPEKFGNVADPDFAMPFLIFHPSETGLCFMNETVVTQSTWSIFLDQAEAVAAYYVAETGNPLKARDFNQRRHSPNPNFKSEVFRLADGLHVKPKSYVTPLRDMVLWLQDPSWLLSPTAPSADSPESPSVN